MHNQWYTEDDGIRMIMKLTENHTKFDEKTCNYILNDGY